MTNPIAKVVCTPVARIVVDLVTVSSVLKDKETVTEIQRVPRVLCAEWTTAVSSSHAVIRKMTCVLLGAGKERTVGGLKVLEIICVDVGKNLIVERDQLLGLIRKIHIQVH